MNLPGKFEGILGHDGIWTSADDRRVDCLPLLPEAINLLGVGLELKHMLMSAGCKEAVRKPRSPNSCTCAHRYRPAGPMLRHTQTVRTNSKLTCNRTYIQSAVTVWCSGSSSYFALSPSRPPAEEPTVARPTEFGWATRAQLDLRSCSRQASSVNQEQCRGSKATLICCSSGSTPRSSSTSALRLRGIWSNRGPAHTPQHCQWLCQPSSTPSSAVA